MDTFGKQVEYQTFLIAIGQLIKSEKMKKNDHGYYWIQKDIYWELYKTNTSKPNTTKPSPFKFPPPYNSAYLASIDKSDPRLKEYYLNDHDGISKRLNS